MSTDGIPSLAEHLASTAAPKTRPVAKPLVSVASLAPRPAMTPSNVLVRRVSQLGPDDTDQPGPAKAAGAPGAESTAAPTNKEEAMPKGVYPRKPKAETEKPVETAPKGKKKRAAKGPKTRRADNQPHGAATFSIDDRGGMQIRDGQQTIQLERADVKRLGDFLKQTAAIRG